MLKHPPSVLVVDDDDAIRVIIHTLLEDEGFSVATAATGWEAFDLADQREFDLALVDVRLEGEIDGIDLVKCLRLRRPHLRVLFISGTHHPVSEDPDRDDFVSKPFRPNELLGCVWELLQRKVPDSDPARLHLQANRAILAARIDSLRNRRRRAADGAETE